MRERDLLIEAKHEIESLRCHNELQAAQLAVVDIFAAALGLRKTEGGMGVDIAWKIECFLNENESSLEEPQRR